MIIQAPLGTDTSARYRLHRYLPLFSGSSPESTAGATPRRLSWPTLGTTPELLFLANSVPQIICI